MVVSTSSLHVSDGADFLAQQTGQLLRIRSRLLKSLLCSDWVWQVPSLSQWVLRQAWRQANPNHRDACWTCDDFKSAIELARQLIENRETLKPLVTDQPCLHHFLEAIDQNSWIRVEVASYYADQLRDLEEQNQRVDQAA